MRTTTRTIAAVALALLASSCVSDGAMRGRALAAKQASQVCDTLSPISYDGRLDTPETTKQIRIYNAKRAAFCAAPKTSK